MNNSLVLIKIIFSYSHSHYTHQQEDTLGLTHNSFILVSELETCEQEFGTDFFLGMLRETLRFPTKSLCSGIRWY